jgi:hypothetical protein
MTSSWLDLEALAFRTGRMVVPTHNDYAACILELRTRIEKLELGAGIHDAVAKELRSSFPTEPEKSLVERVHSCIVGEPECGHMQARAAIREVAAWLQSADLHEASEALELEVKP